MPVPIKLIVGPSPHYHQLKSGQIKYQKSKPASPIWRILVIDEPNNRLHLRVFAKQPSAEDIDKIVMGILSSENLVSNDIVIPKTVERLCPGLQEKLMAHGTPVYLPAHGFASGSLGGKEAEKFLSYLERSLNRVNESMASCEEFATATGSLGFVTTMLWLENGKDRRKFDIPDKRFIADQLAYDITRIRGRDPELGRKIWEKEFYGGPLNRGNHNISPPEDVLSTLLSNPNLLLRKPELKDILLKLKNIRDAEPTQKFPLIRELGALAVIHQIRGIRRGIYLGYNFLSDLNSYLRDKSLRYLVSIGIKEAFKMLIVLDDGLFQVLAAKVTVHYPKDCGDLSLRGIPAHHRLEQMVQQISGGKVAILPELTTPKLGFPEFLQGWEPFSSYRFSSRTPINPAQCLIPVSKVGSQKSEGLLFVLAILARDTKTYIPIGDHEMAGRMTSLVNERLARNGKGVTCQIGPMQMYGDLMEIGDPPQAM